MPGLLGLGRNTGIQEDYIAAQDEVQSNGCHDSHSDSRFPPTSAQPCIEYETLFRFSNKTSKS